MNNTEILISLSKTELQNINGGEVPRAYYTTRCYKPKLG